MFSSVYRDASSDEKLCWAQETRQYFKHICDGHICCWVEPWNRFNVEVHIECRCLKMQVTKSISLRSDICWRKIVFTAEFSWSWLKIPLIQSQNVCVQLKRLRCNAYFCYQCKNIFLETRFVLSWLHLLFGNHHGFAQHKSACASATLAGICCRQSNIQNLWVHLIKNIGLCFPGTNTAVALGQASGRPRSFFQST